MNCFDALLCTCLAPFTGSVIGPGWLVWGRLATFIIGSGPFCAPFLVIVLDFPGTEAYWIDVTLLTTFCAHGMTELALLPGMVIPSLKTYTSLG